MEMERGVGLISVSSGSSGYSSSPPKLPYSASPTGVRFDDSSVPTGAETPFTHPFAARKGRRDSIYAPMPAAAEAEQHDRDIS